MSKTTQSDRRFQAVLEPARLIRWVYMARLSLAWAILIAAIASWLTTDNDKTLIATLVFIVAHVATIGSYVWTGLRRKPLTEAFFYLQLLVDVLLVSGVVHVTDGQFAALYILVNAVAAIVLSVGGALLITALGLVIYAADVLLLQHVPQEIVPLILQLVVFSLAGVGTSYIAVQLKAAGAGREALAAELTRVRLREADILRNIRSGIMSVSQAGELLFANASAIALLGMDLEARIGTPILDDVALVAPGLASALRRAADDGSTGGSRTEGVLRRGELAVPLGVTTTTTADGPGTRTITAIFQDISDQKRLEQLHLRAQRLEAVTELSASLAHEIKNPLASIRSAVEQMSARPAASEDERTLGRLIVRESDRLSRLLSEFLDFARVRVTKQEPVDMVAVVRGACRLAETNPTKAEGVTVHADLPAGALIVDGDEDLLHRAVFNLTLNAVQATRPRTRVRVTVRVAARAQVPGGVASLDAGAALIEVADQGHGIDPSVRDRLFEPFTTTRQGGSGLGLAITHRAIEAHRGVVLVDTNERGTTFSVLLPLHANSAGAGA
ncbi:MAG TPA: ATP-binding protein [Gemmatimonadaceae bacterium]|nr:ATP-binding protein [Gemmatimonadaceae bacterium]